MTEDEMAKWRHLLDGHEFRWTPGVGVGQGAWHAAVHGVAKSQTRLSDWIERKRYSCKIPKYVVEMIQNTFK